MALLALALFGRLPAAEAHLPPPLYIVVDIKPDTITWQMLISVGNFQLWTGIDASTLADGDPAAESRARDAFAPILEEDGPLAIDGVRVQAKIRKVSYMTFDDHGIQWKFAKVTATYPSMGMPRQVDLAWKRYEAALGTVINEIQAEVTGLGKTTYFRFTPKEPGAVWHRPLAPPPPRYVGFTYPPGPTVLFAPVVSWALLLLVLLALPWLRRARRPVGWGTVAVAASLALALTGVGRASFVVGGDTGEERPSTAQAQYVFESLLRNIYRAFDRDTEDGIYDTLSKSVTGDLLDRVYAEVYASLVMQEQGGAVSKVQRVDVLSEEVTFPPGDTAHWYRVKAKWRVHGKVGHYGHTHIRTNEYEALYTVAREGKGLGNNAWRIADEQILNQERVDDGSRRGS